MPIAVYNANKWTVPTPREMQAELDPRLHVKLTLEEMAARMRIAPKQSTHIEHAPPTGKGGELWTRFYNSAIAANHAEPEKMADSLLRVRERSLLIKDARPTTKITLPVKPPSGAISKPAAAPLCKARTLANRPCLFKATHGGFCKKHQAVSFV